MSTELLLEGGYRESSLCVLDPGVERDRTSTVAQKALKAGVIISGACCRFPYYQMNRDVIDHTEGSAIWLDVAGTASFATLYIWSGFGIVRALSFPGTERSDGTRCQVVLSNRLFKAIVAVTGAVLSLVEAMYFANKYNGKNGPIMVAVVLGVNSWMPIFSIMKGLDKLADRAGAEKQELFQRLDNMQGVMLGMISTFISSLDDREQAEIVMSQIKKFKEMESPVERTNAVARLVFNGVDEKGKDNLLVKSAGGLGWLLFAMSLAFFGLFGYEGAKVVYDKEEWAIFIAVVSVIANAYLFGEVIPQSTKALAHEIQGDRKMSLNAQVSPIKAWIFRVTSLVFPAFSFGAIVKGCKDEFENEALRLWFQATVSMGAAVFLKMVMDMASEDALREINKRGCSEEERELLDVLDRARDLQEQVKHASYSDLIQLYGDLPEDVQSALREKIGGDLEALFNQSE